MLLLALDTATAEVSVALHDGNGVAASCQPVTATRHGELLAPAVAAVLDQAGARPADLTGILAGVGPGPYTGLRVGLVTARAMAHALRVPAGGLCSLDAFGLSLDAEPALAVTDARRREVYWAAYDGGRRTHGPSVSRPADLAVWLRDNRWQGRLLGPGAQLYQECFADLQGVRLVDRPDRPIAADLARIAVDRAGAAVPLGLDPLTPLYLRIPDAAVPGERKPALPPRARR